MEAITDIARRYGGLARVPIRGKYLYVLSDPEMLKEMLITHRQKYMKNIRYRHIQALLGQGLLLSEAADWRRQRVITQPAFKPEAIDNSVGWMGQHIDHFLNRWDGLADRGEIFDVEPEFNRLAQLLSGRYLLGEPFADIADEFCEVAAAVKKHWPQAPRNIVSAFVPHSKALIARFDAAIAALDACIYGFIQRHRATDFEGCGVLKRIVMTSRAEGNEFDDKSLRDQIATLFFAGHETSATGLCWIHWALSRHPQFRAQMREEVVSLLGDRLATAEEVHQLQYTGQVIDESLRLHSPIHSISRVAMEDNTVGGYHIPKGTTVAISMYAIHRQEHLYPDPEKFDPSRFSPGERGRAPPLRLPALRLRPSQLHRRRPGAGGAQAHRGAHCAAVRPRAGARPQGRARARHHHVPALRHEDENSPRQGVAVNTPGESRSEQARQFYNAAASASQDFAFMNYGYAPLSAELAGSAEPEKYCLQLYRHLLGSADLRGKKVVEVSCGRGGGAAHVAATYQPASYLGIDISERNLGLATQRFSKVPSLTFQAGNAEALPLPDASCDALLNVEASHLYDNPARFFAEALRVLKSGGTFFHVDLAWKDKDPPAMIAAAGFKVREVEDITEAMWSRRWTSTACGVKPSS